MWGRRDGSLFAIGSQGVEYALVAHWRAEGWLPIVAGQNTASEQSQIVAVSGSVSPITASQIDWAEANGFDLIAFAAEASLDNHRWQAEIDATAKRARATLSSGRSPLVATARGPNDEAITRFRAELAASGCDPRRDKRANWRRPWRNCQASHRCNPRQARRGFGRRHLRFRHAHARRLRARSDRANRARSSALPRFLDRSESGWDRDRAQGRADGQSGFFRISSHRTRDSLMEE